ncbi:hypothetical protein JOC77_004364 [Peribacillus deserti]|uniref:DUF4362 domain-containing protein n=1 Tax=Peribacillus deserti TaxID=673318 RepID=A0ABS2QPL5_9BACI|nr:hypothetical protein [Peribacillus deserti]MBM7694885.1 hypothetical protein [Peribacillus deserti]
MKKAVIIFTLILSLITSGCNIIESKITEEHAKLIVLEYHSKDIGEVKIISVTTKFNKYIIEWENRDNCENGTDSVNTKGELKNIVTTIC